MWATRALMRSDEWYEQTPTSFKAQVEDKRTAFETRSEATQPK